MNKINRILLIFHKTNKTDRSANNIYSVQHMRISGFPNIKQSSGVDYTKKIRVKCKLRSQDCLQQYKYYDVLAPGFVFSRARHNIRTTAVCCHCVLDISSGHIVVGRRSSTRACCKVNGPITDRARITVLYSYYIR